MLIQWSALLITEPEVAMSSVPIQDNYFVTRTTILFCIQILFTYPFRNTCLTTDNGRLENI